MKEIASRIGWYSLIGIFVVPLPILAHEFGHYFANVAFGADGVVLRSVSVTADQTTLSQGQIAFAAAMGPLITYATVVAAGVMVRYRYSALLIVLGLAAPLRGIINFVYIYFRAAGYQPSPNFDEFNFARAMGVDPLIVAIPTAFAVAVILIYFGREAFKKGASAELTAAIVGAVSGLMIWFFVGPRLLP